MSNKDPPYQIRTDNRQQHQMQQNQQQKTRDRAMSLPAALRYNQEIARYSKQKQYDLAIQSFSHMRDTGIAPDVVTYNTMINVFVKSQQLHKAFEIFERMKAERIQPTIVTYTSLIDGCGKCNNFSQAMILYEDVKKKGITLNMHFFNAILNAGLLNGNLYIIDIVLNDVKKTNLKPNTVTFNTLLAGFSRFDQLPRMKEVVEQMIKEGVDFSPITQTTLLQAAQLVRDQNDLRMFLDLLNTAKFVPSVNQASQAVLDLIQAKRLLLAHQLMLNFLQRNIQLTEEVFGAMCLLAGEFGNLVVLQWVIETTRGRGFDLDMKVYIAKININCKFGDSKSAKEMYIRCQHELIPADVKLNIIECSLNNNDIQFALEITQHLMVDNQLNSPEDAGQLLKYLASRDLSNEVLQIYDILKQNLLTVDRNGADSVIQSLLKIDITEEHLYNICDLHPSPQYAYQLIQKIKPNLLSCVSWDNMLNDTNILPHPGTIEDIMASLLAVNLYDQAWNIFKRFVSIGYEATNSLISLAYISQQGKRDHDNMLLIYNAARDAELVLESEIASAALLAALESCNISEALVIHDEVEAARVQFTQEAQEEFKRNFNSVKFCFPNISPEIPSVEQAVRSVKTRKRSSTCPRLRMTPQEDGGFFGPSFDF